MLALLTFVHCFGGTVRVAGMTIPQLVRQRPPILHEYGT